MSCTDLRDVLDTLLPLVDDGDRSLAIASEMLDQVNLGRDVDEIIDEVFAFEHTHPEIGSEVFLEAFSRYRQWRRIEAAGKTMRSPTDVATADTPIPRATDVRRYAW